MTRNCTPKGFTHWILPLGISGAALLLSLWTFVDPCWFGEGRYQTHPIPLGDQMPAMDTAARSPFTRPAPTAEGGIVLRRWSARDLSDRSRRLNAHTAHIALVKLAENTDIDAVNRYLRSARPSARAGSSWLLHAGDYDFALVALTTLLYMFGDKPELLYPETRQYLLDVLLNQDGGEPMEAAPRTIGLVLDTENHHLMTEGSRYLKNQWLATHGTAAQRTDPRYNNQENGLETWLIEYLEEMLHEGVYEFNSRPYIRFTLHALMNLEAYPDASEIRLTARYLLDILNLQYALGSLDLRRNPPFRRQYERASITSMHADPHTAFMRIWAADRDAALNGDSAPGAFQVATLLAELLPYQIPADVRRWTLDKPEHYFARFGRGASACPELYSGGPGYLLSAGGANRGWRSRIVARPVTLLLGDGETDAQQCFHIPGRGHWREWNNTGVYRRFAVANAPVSVPERYAALAESAGWRMFRGAAADSPLIGVYSVANLGIITLFPDDGDTPEAVLAAINVQNPDAGRLQRQFTWPDGRRLEYDPHAPKGTWVMVSDNGMTLDRDYDAWPQLDGDVPALSFER